MTKKIEITSKTPIFLLYTLTASFRKELITSGLKDKKTNMTAEIYLQYFKEIVERINSFETYEEKKKNVATYKKLQLEQTKAGVAIPIKNELTELIEVFLQHLLHLECQKNRRPNIIGLKINTTFKFDHLTLNKDEPYQIAVYPKFFIELTSQELFSDEWLALNFITSIKKCIRLYNLQNNDVKTCKPYLTKIYEKQFDRDVEDFPFNKLFKEATVINGLIKAHLEDIKSKKINVAKKESNSFVVRNWEMKIE